MVVEISSVCIFGDSLSDSGNMKHSHLAGFLPIPGTGLDKSGDGRFADRLTWPGYLTLWRMRQVFPEQIDISKEIFRFFEQDIIVQDGSDIEIPGNPVARNYAVGGATSASYHVIESAICKSATTLKSPLRFLNSLRHIDHIPSTISALGAQAIVTSLTEQRQEFLAEHSAYTAENKKKTLIIEWSGANDLITVNTKPTRQEALRAVKARLLHLEKLFEQGYRNFILFNLPDFSLTPRYQKESESTRQHIKQVVEFFNAQLTAGIAEFRQNHDDCDLLEFDVYQEFNSTYSSPEKYGFSKELLTHNLSDDKKSAYVPTSGIAPKDTEYMFWNDVHPVSKVHEALAEKLIEKIQYRFSFSEHDKHMAQQLSTLKDLPEQSIDALEKLERRIADLGSELSARNFSTMSARKRNKIKGLEYIICKICAAHYHGGSETPPLLNIIRQAKRLFPDLTKGCGFFSKYKSRTEKLLCDLSEDYAEEVHCQSGLLCCT